MKKFIIIPLLFLITSCGKKYDPYKMPADVKINLNKNDFLVFENHISNELIKDSNVEIVSKNKLISDKIGKHIYTLKYRYNNKIYKYDITYNIIDKTKPVFLNSVSSINILVNNDDILCNRISFADNYDPNPTCSIEGDYDFTKTGKYDLEFVIKDSSNNEDRRKFTLNIVDEIEKNNNKPTPNYLYIDDIIKKYKNDNTSIGVDISKWQGNIDFNKIKKAGIEFVIMRIGYQKNPNDEFEIDPKFKEYYEQAKKANLKVSVYLYNVSLTEKDAVKSANYIIKMLNGDKLDLPIGYDFENWSNFNDYNTSLYTLSKSYLAFESILKKHGYDSMLYSSKYYLENAWMNYDNSNVWLAHYTDKTDYQGKYMLWQMTSLCKLDGITENTVDIDILYKNNYIK